MLNFDENEVKIKSLDSNGSSCNQYSNDSDQNLHLVNEEEQTLAPCRKQMRDFTFVGLADYASTGSTASCKSKASSALIDHLRSNYNSHQSYTSDTLLVPAFEQLKTPCKKISHLPRFSSSDSSSPEDSNVSQLKMVAQCKKFV